MRAIRSPWIVFTEQTVPKTICQLTHKSVSASPTTTRMINLSVRQSSAIHDQMLRQTRSESLSQAVHVSRPLRQLLNVVFLNPYITDVMSHCYLLKASRPE
jgi:hypothetical protein